MCWKKSTVSTCKISTISPTNISHVFSFDLYKSIISLTTTVVLGTSIPPYSNKVEKVLNFLHYPVQD